MGIEASIVTEFWQDQLVEHNRQGIFCVLVGFVVSFAFIRMSTRLMRNPNVPWWPGSIVSESGVHLHHLVFGIVTMMLAGALGFVLYSSSPWFEICALAFGVGVGLTIDEFALWVHLEDVYWAEEGRRSIDATVIAVAIGALIFFGARPFEFHTGSFWVVLLSVAIIAFEIWIVFVCFLKERIMHGVMAFLFWPIGWYGAARLGKPRSWWARRFYGERNPKKQQRSEIRFAPDRRTERFKEKFRDVVGGDLSPMDLPAEVMDHPAKEKPADRNRHD